MRDACELVGPCSTRCRKSVRAAPVGLRNSRMPLRFDLKCARVGMFAFPGLVPWPRQFPSRAGRSLRHSRSAPLLSSRPSKFNRACRLPGVR